MKPEKPRRHRIGLVAGITIAVLAIVIVTDFLGAEVPLRREQSQIDASSGQTRFVSTWFGIESEGAAEDTFLSAQLAGETIDTEPDWKPLTTHWGGLLIGAHGHTSWDRAWSSCQRLETLWVEGGFTEAARTECARRILRAFKTHSGAAESLKFVDALRDHVEELKNRPSSERQTTVEDLPAMGYTPD